MAFSLRIPKQNRGWLIKIRYSTLYKQSKMSKESDN